ncbi:MAG: glucosaminidase domain-containing protein [Candidatus Endonucleobacter sp. (ex Gigantidas childressi)]|nr:glucosaminidase domain-containing protein [Candidatus Endonucleobacter sp. (ex Gigantidas childressi)]
MLTKLDLLMLMILGLLSVSSGWVYYDAAEPEIVSSGLGEIQPEVVLPVIGIPDFKSMVDVRRKKKAFFDYMLPVILRENNKLQSLRDKVLAMKNKSPLSASDQKWIKSQGEAYGVKMGDNIDAAFFEQLLIRVDIIPVSLALVQSANESAWGTSRYAVDGYNFFGQWCFSKGCGLVPRQRPSGATYEVRRFSDVSGSVRSYMHNLNTNNGYKRLRELRFNRRKSDAPITGPILAEGLHAYSVRGQDYVNELIDMIVDNNLARYDLQGEKIGSLFFLGK